jgi:prepilin-type N-terminal cleavage/methylation domain-containing protein
VEASVNRPTARRGFTLIEMMVVVAVIGITTAMTVFAFGRQKPRRQLDGMALELRAQLMGARQVALASGTPVAAVVFPDLVTGSGTGRIVFYRDGDFSLFSTAAAVNLDNLDAAAPAVGGRSEIVETLDLDNGVVVGPATGQGASAVMPAPFGGIAINVACLFCTGADRRGAIVFQPNGTVTFQDRAGPPLALPQGASLSLTRAESDEVRTITIAASTGLMQTLKWSPTP